MRFFTLFVLLFHNVGLIAQDPLAPQPPDTTTEEVYSSPQVMPEFPGGQAAFTKYLQTNIHYPDSAKKYGHEGTVYVYFEIMTDGRIKNASCKRGIQNAPELCDEAIRVIASMPNWVPGKMNGRPVICCLSMPIKFTLQ